MSTVVVAATTKPFSVPADSVTEGTFYKITIDAGTGNAVSQVVTSPTATFAGVVAGNYTATVQLVDIAGASIGPSATATFTVVDETTVVVNIPDVVSATVSADVPANP